MNNNNTKLTIGIVLAVLLIIIGVSRGGAKPNNPTTDPIIIGGAFALTGDAAEWGEVSQNGAQIAIDEINERGGVNGRLLELRVEDTKSTAKDTVSAVTKLHSIDGAKVILPSWIDIYQGVANVIAKDTRAFIISPDSGIEAMNSESIHPRTFSLWHRTEVKADLAIQDMALRGVKKAFYIVEKDPYYEWVLRYTRASAAKHGIEIISEQPTDVEGIKSVVAKIPLIKPDAVFVGFYGEQSNYEFLTRYRTFVSSSDNLLLYGDELIAEMKHNPKFPKGIFDGIIYYETVSADDSFVQKYSARYNSVPQFGASTAYDAIYIAADVLRNNPENIDEYIRSKTFDTTTFGKITIDEIGGVSKSKFALKKVINDKSVEIQVGK